MRQAGELLPVVRRKAQAILVVVHVRIVEVAEGKLLHHVLKHEVFSHVALITARVVIGVAGGQNAVRHAFQLKVRLQIHHVGGHHGAGEVDGSLPVTGSQHIQNHQVFLLDGAPAHIPLHAGHELLTTLGRNNARTHHRRRIDGQEKLFRGERQQRAAALGLHLQQLAVLID